MNFSKVKLVICLCLLTVNVVFGIICIKLVMDRNYIPEEETALAEKHLLKMGVNAQFDKNAHKLYNLPIYAVESTGEEKSNPKIYREITEAFFGVLVDDSAYVRTPDGYSMSVKNEKGILLGTSYFTDNNRFECYVEGKAEYKDITEISKLPVTSEIRDADSAQAKKAAAFINKAFKNYDLKFSLKGERDYKGGKIISFTGELSDTDILDIYVNVYVNKDKILCCAGSITDNVPRKKYRAELIDSIDIMYMATEHIREAENKGQTGEIEIEKLSMNYKVYDYTQGLYYIIPTWVVEYSINSDETKIITVDAVVGENTEILKR